MDSGRPGHIHSERCAAVPAGPANLAARRPARVGARPGESRSANWTERGRECVSIERQESALRAGESYRSPARHAAKRVGRGPGPIAARLGLRARTRDFYLHEPAELRAARPRAGLGDLHAWR